MRSLPFSLCFSPLAFVFFFASCLSKEMFPLKLRLRRNLGKGGFPAAAEVRSGVPSTAGSLWGMRWGGGASPEGLLEEVMEGGVAVLPSSDIEFFGG